jgi:hypothetical protein
LNDAKLSTTHREKGRTMTNETPFEYLMRETLYAVRSNEERLVYEVYGAMGMAHSLGAITDREARCFNTALVVNWMNNPADREKYAKEISRDSVIANVNRRY